MAQRQRPPPTLDINALHHRVLYDAGSRVDLNESLNPAQRPVELLCQCFRIERFLAQHGCDIRGELHDVEVDTNDVLVQLPPADATLATVDECGNGREAC